MRIFHEATRPRKLKDTTYFDDCRLSRRIFRQMYHLLRCLFIQARGFFSSRKKLGSPWNRRVSTSLRRPRTARTLPVRTLPKRLDILIESVGKMTRPSPTVSREVIYRSYPGEKEGKSSYGENENLYQDPYERQISIRTSYCDRSSEISRFVRI